jgi:hypothetical protein
MGTKNLQTVTVGIGRTVSEYDSIEVEVRKNATDQEIIDAANRHVKAYINNGDNPFCDGPDLDTACELRITSIDKDDDNTHVTDYAPIEPVYSAMGYDLLDAAQRLELGGMSENQFILEALNSVYRNAPDPENAVSRAFIASYEECALEDTRQKIGMLLQSTEGVMPSDPDQMTLTMKNDRGEVQNRNIMAPGIIIHNGEPIPVFYPYKNQKTGEVALVYRDLSRTSDPDPVTAVYPDGTERTFSSVMAFNQTGMLRVRDHEEGEDIIQRISPFIARPEGEVRYAGRPEGAEPVTQQATDDLKAE